MMSKRVRPLNNTVFTGGECVLYLMSRDQRVSDNFTLLEAQHYALEHKLPLLVMFTVFTQSSGRLLQQYEFMIEGLKEVEERLHELQIPFCVTTGTPLEEAPKAVTKYKANAVFLDFSPLREACTTRMKLARTLNVPVFEVDSTNVIPLWITSDKEEYAAATIRGKVHRHLKEFLVEPDQVKKHPHTFSHHFKTNWDSILQSVEAERPDFYNPPFTPGEKAARSMLKSFISSKLESYATERNKPEKDGLSGLSPYFHYGQLSTLRANLEIQKAAHGSKQKTESADAFLEESIVRRELAQNYCFYNKNYTTIQGAKPWAIQSLKQHEKDKREYLYSKKELEFAKTHDEAWNAAQIQLITTGKMHGYMRMYWAKKILEWTPTPEKAIEIAIYLNDKYELDGYDANGYVGIMWSIAGIHDRPWFERPVFGKIRYMNFNGLKRKFDIDEYIKRFSGLPA